MAHGSSARRAERAAIRAIRVKIAYQNPDIKPVDDIFQGTAREVIDWVGTSEIRARRALARELDSDSPRILVVENMHKLLQAKAG